MPMPPSRTRSGWRSLGGPPDTKRRPMGTEGKEPRVTERTRTAEIVISDREPGMPFSKGLLASQVMVTGLSAYRSYQVAEEVEMRLLERRRTSVTSAELAATATE